MKKSLLIINLGTPNTPSYLDVFKYLREFLSDENVLNINPILRFILVNFIICPFRSFSSSKIYKKVWDSKTGSPLLYNTQMFAYKLSKKLNTQYFSNIEKALEKCRADGVIIATPNSVHKKNAELFIKKKYLSLLKNLYHQMLKVLWTLSFMLGSKIHPF